MAGEQTPLFFLFFLILLLRLQLLPSTCDFSPLPVLTLGSPVRPAIFHECIIRGS